jgi:hypothetical protein
LWNQFKLPCWSVSVQYSIEMIQHKSESSKNRTFIGMLSVVVPYSSDLDHSLWQILRGEHFCSREVNTFYRCTQPR